MIKLIAVDLDGTLLTSDKKITEYTKKVIQKVRQKGIKFVLCTGRPIKAIENILAELDLLNDGEYAITFNGGLVQKNHNGEILHRKGHTLDDVMMIHQMCLSHGLPVNPIDLNYVYTLDEPSDNKSQYHTVMTSLEFIPFDQETINENHLFNKVVTCCSKELLDKRSKELPAVFFEQFNTLKSRPILLEILPKGVDKAYGLKYLCKHLNIDASEVMTLGDEENDVAMIEYAKYGIAMGNATDYVKSIAHDVTDTNDCDGVAKALEKYILKDGE